ncbi:MAG: hypothetical protein AAF267_10005 [Deinococcota bacterium]
MNTPQLRVMCARCQAIFVPDVQLDANVSDVNVSDVNVSDVNVSDVNVSDVNVSDVNVSDVNVSDVKVSDVASDNSLILTCPSCGHRGPAQRVMNVATFPSLEAFKHNWHASRASTDNNKSDD